MPPGAPVDFSAKPAEPAYEPWTLHRGAQTDLSAPVPPKDFRTRMHEALSDENIRYYAGPGFYDFLKKFAPLVQFLPGAGAVQSMDEGTKAKEEFDAGNYGKAATHLAAGTASGTLEFVPPAKYLSLLIGPLARFFPHERVPLAEMMERAQISPDEIWQATRLERDAAGHWRSEISDKGYRVNPKAGILDDEGFREAALFDQIIHPPLRENYPGFAAGRSRLRTGPQARDRGIFMTGKPGTVEADVSSKLFARWQFLHELQHMIDHYEGFPRGGGIVEFHPGTSMENAQDQYKRLMGEVAARNAQWRLSMSEKERLRKPPSRTELELEYPVPRYRQIERYSRWDD